MSEEQNVEIDKIVQSFLEEGMLILLNLEYADKEILMQNIGKKFLNYLFKNQYNEEKIENSFSKDEFIYVTSRFNDNTKELILSLLKKNVKK